MSVMIFRVTERAVPQSFTFHNGYSLCKVQAGISGTYKNR